MDLVPVSTRLVSLLLLAAPAVAAQTLRDHGTIVIVMGAEPNTPIPTLAGFKQNQDVADLLFLRLAHPGRALNTAVEKEFVPELARSWQRRDPLTLVFELDPRAHWHDGHPVTARDVVWSIDRARDSTVNAQYALLLRQIASVTAEGDRRVVFRFRRAYPEQLYDATWHVQPLPAHLVDTVPRTGLAGSAFVRQPIGNGPYRFGRRDPGRQLELVADTGFFLGRPRLERVVFLVVREAEAQLNLVLDGTADALEAITPVSNIPRITANPALRIATVPSFSVGYLLFNLRAAGDRSKPHPILADPDVRRAIAMAIDRERIVRATFGPYAATAEAPLGQGHWLRREAPHGARYDPAAARGLLERKGWVDRDSDGYRERAGVPLLLRLSLPGTSAVRVTLAAQIQEMLRQVGIRLELVRLEGPVWFERRNRGEFDIDFSSATLDPTPSGMVQSWSCAGLSGANVGQYCNPVFDSLLTTAIALGEVTARWQAALRVLQTDAPAVFLYSPLNAVAVHTRYRDVTLRPESLWADLWRWSVEPTRRLPRDDLVGR